MKTNELSDTEQRQLLTPTLEMIETSDVEAPTVTTSTEQGIISVDDACSSDPISLVAKQVYQIKWNNSSHQVFFNLPEDIHSWFVADIGTGEVSSALNPEFLVTPTIPSFVFDDMSRISQLEDWKRTSLIMSPSGNKALFIISYTEDSLLTPPPTPAPTPDGEGGGSLYEKINEVYLLADESEPVKLGQFNGPISDIYWLSGEERVLVTMDWRSVHPLGLAHVWDFNLRSPSIDIFLSTGDVEVPYIRAISPDGAKLIISYRTEPNLYSMDLSNRLETKLAFSTSGYVWWRNGSDELIVVDKINDKHPLIFNAYLYRVSNENKWQLSNADFSPKPFIPDPIILSPDGSKFAYIEANTGHLYLLPLCLPE